MTAKEWNKSKNTFRKVYRNMRAAHPYSALNDMFYMTIKNKFRK